MFELTKLESIISGVSSIYKCVKQVKAIFRKSSPKVTPILHCVYVLSVYSELLRTTYYLKKKFFFQLFFHVGCRN